MNKSKEPQMPRIDQIGVADIRPRDERDLYDSLQLQKDKLTPVNEVTGLTMPSSQEVVVSAEEIEAVISSVVHYDAEHMETSNLMQPEVMTEQALKAYDLYVSDTNYPAEAVVALYVHELSDILIAEAPQVTQAEVNKFVEDVEEFVKNLNFELSVEKLEPVITKS